MNHFLRKLLHILGGPAHLESQRGGRNRRSIRRRLQIESLENRLMPAVYVQPRWGAESITDAAQLATLGGGEAAALLYEIIPDLSFLVAAGTVAVDAAAYAVHAAVKNPKIQLIFWGSWTPSLMQQYYDAAASLLESSFLQVTTQYGTNGYATLNGSYWVDSDFLPSVLGDGALCSEVDAINHGNSDPHTIYAFVTPSAQTHWNDNSSVGYNTFTKSFKPIPAVWDGDGGTGSASDIDSFTWTLSHEISEMMSSPTTWVKPGSNPNAQIMDSHSIDQIGDFEANEYHLRLGNGVSAQPMWSDKAQMFELYTNGDASDYVLTAQWDNSTNPATFKKSYTMQVAGNAQGFGDEYDIFSTSGGGFGMSFEGDTAEFDPGMILNTTVNSNKNSTVVIKITTGDTLTINDAASGLQVTVDGSSIQFNPGSISSITIQTSGGSKIINVQALSASDSITIKEGASARDTVNLSPTGNNLANIQSNISVNGTGGAGQLTLAGAYGGPLAVTLTGPRSGSLPLGTFVFSYTSVGTVTLSPSGTISKLTLQGGPFATELDTVSDAGVGSVQFDGALLDHGTLSYKSVTELDDLVTIQSAEFDFTGNTSAALPYVAIVDGPVVNGVHTTSLQQSIVYITGNHWWGPTYSTVIDPVEFANKGDVTVQSGPENATIDMNNPHPAAGLSTLEIDPGAGTTQVTVESTSSAVATTVTNDGIWFNVETVTLNAPGQGMQAIDGTVDVEDPNYYTGAATYVVIDDSGDKRGRTSYLLDGQITGLAPAKITWGAISSLTITGGGGGNSFNVSSLGNLPETTLNAGSGGDIFTVMVSAVSRLWLAINGGPGYDQLYIDTLSPTQQVGQTHGVVSISSPVSKNDGSVIKYKDIEKVDVNTPIALGGGNGLDGNGNVLPPSLGGISFLPQNLGGPEQGNFLF